MKKALSLLLALIISLSVFTALPAYADDYSYTIGYYDSEPDYHGMSLVQGKKGGEIYGYFETARREAARLEGGEEFEAIYVQLIDKTQTALAAARKANVAVCEVEKDKEEMELIAGETEFECIQILEGFGSAMGDPSITARDMDIVRSTSKVAISDAETAVETGSRQDAERALLELCDAEVTFANTVEASGRNVDLCNRVNNVRELYERILRLREKTHADIEEANRLVENYYAEVYSIIAFMEENYVKMAPAVENAPADHKSDYEFLLGLLHNHTNEVKADFGLSYYKYESVDENVFEDAIDECKRELFLHLADAREYVPSAILPRFFVAPNTLTENGTAQQLVTPGTDMEGVDTSQIKYAIGEKPGYLPEDALISDDYLYNSEYSTQIPTAEKAGDYWVYCKFPSTEGGTLNFCVKVTVAKAQPAPAPAEEKKDNPLYVKGKTVKVKYSKKKNRTVKRAKALAVRNAQGAVTYKKTKGNKKITVAKNGKITVKKGLKKGTYKIKVKVTAAGNSNYNKITKTVTVTVKVK